MDKIVAGMSIGLAFIAAVFIMAVAQVGIVHVVMDDVAAADEGKTSLTVEVGGPKQVSVQTGQSRSLMTMYLPVNMTQTITLIRQTENITVYPVFSNWDGLVKGYGGSSIVDDNGEPVSYDAFGFTVLHGVNATCAAPYPISVSGEINGDGIQIENATAPISSGISWGDAISVKFHQPQSGVIHYGLRENGIVPADYNNETNRESGAGNQEVSGTYHLIFASFYPATVNLPVQAELTSLQEFTCTNNADSPHVLKSEFLHIFVYDVWFTIN